jgi:hypothetical protein
MSLSPAIRMFVHLLQQWRLPPHRPSPPMQCVLNVSCQSCRELFNKKIKTNQRNGIVPSNNWAANENQKNCSNNKSKEISRQILEGAFLRLVDGNRIMVIIHTVLPCPFWFTNTKPYNRKKWSIWGFQAQWRKSIPLALQLPCTQ